MNSRTHLVDLSYTWDANKIKTSESITGGMSGYGFTSAGTTYDFEDRLTGFSRAATSGPALLSQSWNLTSVGDWTSVTTNGTAQNRTHGPTHELLTAGGQNVATDVKGNITTLPANLRPTGATTAMNLTWDSDNKLRSADIDANGTADVNFQYDALGRRVARSGTGGSVVFVQMDQQTIADYPVGGAATTPTFRYVYARYIDEPVVRKTAGTGGTLVYFHRNHQYSVTAVTTSTGAIAERYAYSAYGQPTILDASASVLSSSAINNRYAYTGREWDATLGLYHFRARWMSPSAGRFLGRDPIGFEGSEWGLYSYAKTNPTRYVDWNGKSPQDPVPPIDKPIPGGGANWDCTTKKAENRKQKSFPVILNTCCKGTLDVFIYAVRCFEPGWEDGGVNRVPPAPIPTDAELAQHFYTKVEVRFRLGGFTPAGCGEDKRWSSSSCNVYPGRFLSALTGDWVTWPPVGAPLEMIDFNESRFLGAACESTKNVPPGTTK